MNDATEPALDAQIEAEDDATVTVELAGDHLASLYYIGELLARGGCDPRTAERIATSVDSIGIDGQVVLYGYLGMSRAIV